MMRVPVGPPATPVAMTGMPSVFSARATLTPLPPAIAVCSTARWRRPRRKFGTASVLSIAALSVTVMIIRSPTPLALPNRPHPQRKQRDPDEQREQGYSGEPAAEGRRGLSYETGALDVGRRDERYRPHDASPHEHLHAPHARSR